MLNRNKEKGCLTFLEEIIKLMAFLNNKKQQIKKCFTRNTFK